MRGGAYDVKEKDIVDEINPAASSNHSDERRMAMTKLVKGIPSFCSNYTEYLRKSADKHVFSVEKDFGWRLDFFSVRCSVHRTNKSSEYPCKV